MDAPENLHQVTSSEHLQELLSKDLKRVSLLYFWAPWAEPCKQMTEVVKELTRKYPEVLSLQIEAEEQSEIAESFDIGSVPLVLLLRVRRHLPPSHFRLRLIFFSSLRVTHFSPALRVQTPRPSPPPLRTM